MESSLAATCWQAGRRPDPRWRSRPAGLSALSMRWVKEPERFRRCPGRQSSPTRGPSGRKIDLQATSTYMWDTRPKEPPMLQDEHHLDDRRVHRRAPLDVLANRFLDGYPYLCRATDISPRGI